MVRFLVYPMVLVSLLLSGCVDRPNRPRPAATPKPTRHADPQVLRQCIARLDRMVARYTLLPDRTFGAQCDALGAVQLTDIGTPTSNLGAMTCGLGEAFTRWVQGDLQGPAQEFLGSRVVKIESMGTYSCRNIAGTGRLSEHAHANAVDVGAFVLADGRRLSVQEWWFGDGEAAQFLRAVRDAGCRRFTTVLSPDYNAAHHDHLHFDLGGKPFCR